MRGISLPVWSDDVESTSYTEVSIRNILGSFWLKSSQIMLYLIPDVKPTGALLSLWRLREFEMAQGQSFTDVAMTLTGVI